MLTLYKASAGSGKTFTLALTYITLLLGYRTESGEWRLRRKTDSYAHKSILAVTFTNKATAEMKKRIIEELAMLSSADTARHSAYAPLLQNLFKSELEPISEAAREVLVNLLLNFTDFNVSTIDSFFQNVLRTFARELELPDNFELRLDEKDVIAEAVKDILDTVNGNSMLLSNDNAKVKTEEGSLFNWLKRFMEMNLDQGNKFNLFNRDGRLFDDLVSHLMALMDEHFKLKYDEIVPWVRNVDKIVELESYLIKNIRLVKRSIQQGAVRLLEREEELKHHVDDNIISSNIAPTIKQWANGDIDLSKELPTTFNTIIGGESKKAVYITYFKNSGPDDPFLNEICQYCAESVGNFERLSVYRFILAHLYPVGLLGELLIRLEKIRQQKTTLMLSDTTDFLSKIIEEEDAPFIYERIGTRLHHFLLDEFQDTSLMQWNNLKPLLVESLSAGNDNLIIGDEKQCIYRFRNSDPSLINHVVESQMSLRQIEVLKKGEKIEDNTNWRSAPEIVKFNNSLFVVLRKHLGIDDIYGGVVQLIPEKAKNLTGYVDVKIIDTKSGEGGTARVEEIGLSRMADAIKRQIDAGYKPSEIAVLVRSGEQGNHVIRYLLDYFNSEDWGARSKPQVISADSLTLNESRIVKMIISKLRLIVDSGLYKEKKDGYYKSKEELNLLLNRFFINNLSSLDASKALEDAVEGFDNSNNETLTVEKNEASCALMPHRNIRNDVPAKHKGHAGIECTPDLMSAIRGIMTDILAPMGEEGKKLLDNEGVFVSTFLDQTIEFVNRDGNDISGFLRWWDVMGNTINVAVPDSIDAISVMTIHKAKGLEFPCVHIPMLSFELIRKNTSFQRNYHWFDLKEFELYEIGLLPRYLPFEVCEKVGKIKGLKKEYDDLRRQELIDNVNLVYVALTRASRELVVTGVDIRDKNGVTNRIGGVILDSVNQSGGNSCNSARENEDCFFNLLEFLKDDGCLIIGEPTKPQGKGDEKTESAIMPCPLLGTEKRIAEVTTPEIFEDIDCEDKVQWGWFLHKILSRVRNCADLTKAIDRTAIEHNVASRYVDKAHEVLENALGSEDVYFWFNEFERVLNETEITFIPQEDELKKKRPDRIVWTADGHVDVVDYKFGEYNAKYKNQVKTYMMLLVQMGIKNVRGYIWYPLTMKIQEVTL